MSAHEFLETPRPLSHPAMPDWTSTAFNFPEDAETCLREHYGKFQPHLSTEQIDRIVEDVAMATMQTTVQRKELERANLLSLDLRPDEFDEYHKFAGNLALSGESVIWFAQKAARAFRENRDPKLNKISLELGGNRQYGLWSVTKEVDEIAWELSGQLQEFKKPEGPVKNLRRFTREGDTPIKYRFWPRLNGKWSLDATHSGNVRRRRGVLNAVIRTKENPFIDEKGSVDDTIEVKPFKQAEGILVFDALAKERVSTLLKKYQSLPSEERDNSDIQNAADRYAGTIFREAIRQKETSPHSVAPIGAAIVMVAHRPEWAPAAKSTTKILL